MDESQIKKAKECIRKKSFSTENDYLIPVEMKNDAIEFLKTSIKIETIHETEKYIRFSRGIGEKIFGTTDTFAMSPPCQWGGTKINFSLEMTPDVRNKIKQTSVLDACYLIPKQNLSTGALDSIRNELIMVQESTITDAKTREKFTIVDKSTNLFFEDQNWLGVPKSWGLHHFGVPEKIRMPDAKVPDNPSAYRFEVGGTPLHQTYALEKLWDTLDKERGAYLFMDCGLGKCLDSNTPIFCYSENKQSIEVVLCQNIKVGDYLIGADGLPVQVKGTCFGTGPMYKICDVMGNTLFICNDQHLIVHVTRYALEHKKINNFEDLTLNDLCDFRAKYIHQKGENFYQIRYKVQTTQIAQNCIDFENWDVIESKIEKLGIGCYFGFTLDESSDGRFLLANGIISHNTATMLRHHATRKPPARRMIVVQKEFLLRQMENAARHFLPEMQIGYFWGKKEEFADLTLCMERTLIKRYQKDPKRVIGILSQFHGILVDEAHHATAPEFAQLLVNLPCKEIVCVTATRSRKNGSHIFWPTLVGKGSVSIFRKPQQLEYITLKHPFVVEEKRTRRKVAKNKWVETTNTANVVSSLAEKDEMISLCIRVAWKLYKMGRWIIGLCERTDQSKRIYDGLVALLKNDGKTEEEINDMIGLLVGGHDPLQDKTKRKKGDNKRKRIAAELEKHRSRQILIGNFQMAQEAIDLPFHDTLVLFGDLTSMQQPEGRIQRIKIIEDTDCEGSSNVPHVPVKKWIFDLYCQKGYLRSCFEQRKRFFVDEKRYNWRDATVEEWLEMQEELPPLKRYETVSSVLNFPRKIEMITDD